MFPDKLEGQVDGLAPLHLAVWNGNIPAVKILIGMGVTVNLETTESNRKTNCRGADSDKYGTCMNKKGCHTQGRPCRREY